MGGCLSLRLGARNPSSAAAWSPSNLAIASVHWFDMQDAAARTIDGSTNIQQWNDKGSAAANAVQASSAARPAYVAASNINSLPAARIFNGNTKGLPFTSSLGPLTSCQFTSGGPNSFRVVLDGVDRDSGAVFGTALTSPGVFAAVWTAGTGTATVTFYSTGNQVAQLTGQTISAAGAVLFVGDFNNGGTLNSGRVISTNTLLNVTALTRAPDGDVGEIMYLNYAPSSGDRQKLEGYLAHKWGTTASLPGAHPYKSSPPTV